MLIIDEAQNLAPDVLEQLRLLTNLETNERKLLQIVLIGQPELRTMLARPELEQLAQRVIARFHLDALTEPETTQYIEHRLAVAGHTGPPPFDAAALQRIHRLARGVPRRINLLCGRALLGAWATGQHRVDRKVVDKAAAEVFGPEIAGSAGGPHRHLRNRPGSWPAWACSLVPGWRGLGSGWDRASHPEPPRAAARHSAGMPAPALVGASSRDKGLRAPRQASASPVYPPAGCGRPASRPAADSLDALLAQMPGDIDAAWRELAPAWKLPAADATPCQAAADSPAAVLHGQQPDGAADPPARPPRHPHPAKGQQPAGVRCVDRPERAERHPGGGGQAAHGATGHPGRSVAR